MNTKPVSLKTFPVDLYQRAKAKAALDGMSLPELFRKAVEEYLKRKRSARNGNN